MPHRLPRSPYSACAPVALVAMTALLSGCALFAAPEPAPAVATLVDVAEPAPALPPPPPIVRPVETKPQAPATQPPQRVPDPLNVVLGQAERMRGLSNAELNAELTRLNEAVSAAPTDSVLLMQQALTLLQTRGNNDQSRAQALLQRLAADNSTETSRLLQPLARLLLVRLQEQRRAEDERDRQSQQLKDAQRRIDQLNDRLEAVRAIERSFGRPAPSNGTPPRSSN